MLTTVVAAFSAVNRWLLAGIVAALAVLLLAAYARRQGRSSARRGQRRRAGSLIALGPLIGLAFAPTFRDLAVLVAVGTFVVAIAGAAIERTPRVERLAALLVVVSAVVAVAAGARIGPTGVGVFDVLGAFLLICAVMKSVDGLGNADGLATGAALSAGACLFGVAAFAHQDGLATVLMGLVAACFAFLAFNVRPASLFVGRGGRLGIGFALSVGALAVQPVHAPWRELATPLILLSIFLLDACFVVLYRTRRRRSLLEHRNDHVFHRLVALGWTTSEAVLFLCVAQLFLALIALFTARGIMPFWLVALASLVILLTVGIEAGRARLERERPCGLPPWAWIVTVALVAWLVVATAPLALALAASDTVDLMQKGREAATRALDAARSGDTITARAAFLQASSAFRAARGKLDSPLVSSGLGVPFLASNVRAARTLADIGHDLADAGESLSVAVDPDALRVVDGTLPIAEVRRVTPRLEVGAHALTDARERLDDLRVDPYLVGPVREAVDKVYTQLVRADREASHAAAAAKLAPAIFGADGQRTYLMVVQNNAESRATGGFIGSYALVTARDGALHVGELLRTNVWNEAIAAQAELELDAPKDYRLRYAQYRPQYTLQNVNLSPDFPSVAHLLEKLAPQAGLPPIDGVLSVDPAGLAALLQLTGPVNLAPSVWPTPIDSANVVNVTLRDAYAQFASTPERADFLGDVAKAALDTATRGSLGKPAEIAKVLGAAAHAGHLMLAFTRTDEQRLAEQLEISGQLAPVRSDALAVTSSNFAGNKIDYYLDRTVDYRVTLTPDDRRQRAQADADLTVTLDNTAPADGLPRIVIGPFIDGQFVAGENRTMLSMYSPLSFVAADVDGRPTAVSPARERGRNVYSLIEAMRSRTKKVTNAKLSGPVRLHDGWYELQVRAQPTLNADRLHVSVDVPEGWKIDAAPRMERDFARRASATVDLTKDTTFRLHLAPDAGAQNLWERLVDGS